MLTNLRDDMAAGNRDAVLAQMARMSTEAARGRPGLPEARAAGRARRGRGRARRADQGPPRPRAGQAARGGRDRRARLGAAQPDRRAADAGLRRRPARARGARRRSGHRRPTRTRLFAALTGRTPIQIAAMRKAYSHVYDGATWTRTSTTMSPAPSRTAPTRCARATRPPARWPRCATRWTAPAPTRH